MKEYLELFFQHFYIPLIVIATSISVRGVIKILTDIFQVKIDSKVRIIDFKTIFSEIAFFILGITIFVPVFLNKQGIDTIQNDYAIRIDTYIVFIIVSILLAIIITGYQFTPYVNNIELKAKHKASYAIIVFMDLLLLVLCFSFFFRDVEGLMGKI